MMPNQTTLRILLYKYKDFLLPVGIILICLFTITLILIPQAMNLVTRESDSQTTRDQIATLQQNLTTIQKFDTAQMQLNLQRVNRALPVSKDFGSIIDTLQRAAKAANITLSDYSFQIGDITAQNAKTNTFQVSISLIGDAKGIASFLRAITHQLPLADITDVHGNLQNASVALIFYYQPQNKVTVSATNTFAPLSAQETQTLSTLATFDTQK